MPDTDTTLLDSATLGAADTLGQNQADLATAQNQYASATAERDQIMANFDPQAVAGDQPTFNAPTPQDHFNDVMKQAPFMMALGAIGGALGKQHGITMLASTNAMMKGVVQGSADAYKDARDKYDQQYQDFRDKSKTWLDVYKAYATAYKGQLDAAQKAVTAANASVGIYEKATNNSTSQVAHLIQLRKSLEVSNAKIQAMSQDEIIKQLREERLSRETGIKQQNADANTTRAGASVTNANTRKSKSDDKSAEIDASTQEVVNMGNDLEKQLNENTTLMTGRGSTLRRGAEFVGTATGMTDSAPATKFKDDVALWRTKVTGLLKSKGKMGADERKVLNDALNVLDGATSRRQALDAISQVNKLLSGGFKSSNRYTPGSGPTAGYYKDNTTGKVYKGTPPQE
jgi:hypothetical protein